MKDVLAIEPIDREEMAVLAMTEYQRLFGFLESLSPDEWATQTVCDDWDVRLMVAHLLGAAEGNASIVESLRQLVKGKRVARRDGVEDIDGINAVQVPRRVSGSRTPDLGPVFRFCASLAHRFSEPRPRLVSVCKLYD